MNQNYQINSIFSLLKPMLYIFLAVFTGVLLLVLFKLFQKNSVNTPVAIVFNYFIAAITGILFLNAPLSIAEVIDAPWLKISLLLGGLFVVVFYLISLTAQKISISTASVSNKMSVVMPVLFSLTYLQETLTFLKIGGIFLALIALYFSSRSGKDKPPLKNLIWLPVFVFIGSGLIDIIINHANAFYLSAKNHNAFFTLTSFLFAFCFGIVFLIILIARKKLAVKDVFKPKNIIGGIALGIPNYFSIFFIFKALETHVLKSSQLFPVLNLSNVLLAAGLGFILFKEKLSTVSIIGIVLAAVSIILIAA